MYYSNTNNPHSYYGVQLPYTTYNNDPYMIYNTYQNNNNIKQQYDYNTNIIAQCRSNLNMGIIESQLPVIIKPRSKTWDKIKSLTSASSKYPKMCKHQQQNQQASYNYQTYNGTYVEIPRYAGLFKMC